MSSFCATQKLVQSWRQNKREPACSPVAKTSSTMPARSANHAHECCNLKTYRALAQPLVAKPTQVTGAFIVPIGQRIFRATLARSNRCAARASIATVPNFAHTLRANTRNHPMPIGLRAEAGARRMKSGMNLALACPNDLQALKLLSVVMHRMRLRDCRD